LARCREPVAAGLASCDAKGGIYYDASLLPLADGGLVREPLLDELIPAPAGTLEMLLPQRRPLTTIGPVAGRDAMAVALPAGYTRLLLPAYAAERNAPALPLFGYTLLPREPTKAKIGSRAGSPRASWKG
jgi:hypothetical protein